MDETVDGKKVGVADGGSIPPTSTKPDWYYYTAEEWSRAGMWGPLPPERNKQLLTNEGGDLDFDGASEILLEDSSTL